MTTDLNDPEYRRLVAELHESRISWFAYGRTGFSFHSSLCPFTASPEYYLAVPPILVQLHLKSTQNIPGSCLVNGRGPTLLMALREAWESYLFSLAVVL